MLTRSSCPKTDEFLGAFEFDQLSEENRGTNSEQIFDDTFDEDGPTPFLQMPDTTFGQHSSEAEIANFVAVENITESEASVIEGLAKDADEQPSIGAINGKPEDYLAESDDIDFDGEQLESYQLPSPPETPMAVPAPAASEFPPSKEEFVQLGKVIMQARESQKLQVLAMCGATRGDGASFVTNNLSQALAENKELRIARFEIYPSGNSALEMVRNDTSDSFQIAIRRTPIPNVSEITTPRGGVTLAELLRGCDTQVLLEMLRKRFDLILIDLPAITTEEHTAQFAALTDGVVIIAQQNGEQRSPVDPARNLLSQANARVLGVVLNHRREIDESNVRQVA